MHTINQLAQFMDQPPWYAIKRTKMYTVIFEQQCNPFDSEFETSEVRLVKNINEACNFLDQYINKQGPVGRGDAHKRCFMLEKTIVQFGEYEVINNTWRDHTGQRMNAVMSLKPAVEAYAQYSKHDHLIEGID